MKAKIIRIMCLMLVCVFILPALVACPDKDKDKGIVDVTGSGEDRFKETDFGGEKIKLCLPGANSGSDGAKYMSGLDEKSGKPFDNDTITETIRERNEYVSGKLNLAVEYVYLDSNYTAVYDDIMTKFNAHDGFADAAAIMFYGMVQCMMSGIFVNANTDQYTNYFDLTETGWYEDSMQAFSFGADMANGKVYLLASDYFLDIIRCADVMLVNEKVFESKVGGTIDDLYYHVVSGSFTYDRLNEWVSRGYSNSNASNPGVDLDDDLGLIHGSNREYAYPVPGSAGTAMAYSVAIDYMSEVGGSYEYADVTNGMTAFISKAKALFDNEGVVPVTGNGGNSVVGVFAKDKTMFAMSIELMDLENSAVDAIQKCPLPYPKLTQTDSYKVLVHDGATVGGIFKGAKFTEVSAFWQYATIRSEATRLKYYEDGLGLKYETGNDTSEMLDVIYNSITTSMTYVWDSYIAFEAGGVDSEEFASTAAALFSDSIENGNYASNWAQWRELKQSGLAKAQNKFNSLN